MRCFSAVPQGSDALPGQVQLQAVGTHPLRVAARLRSRGGVTTSPLAPQGATSQGSGGAIRLGVQHRCSAISGQVGNQMHVDLRACEVLVSEQVLDFDER